MNLLKDGKTKEVYTLTDGNILFKFKDTITGNGNTGVKDPGGNQVIGTEIGVGKAAVEMSIYYFELLKKYNIPTHYIKHNKEENKIFVKPATFFGKGLECIIRYTAAGSFVRRFGLYCKEGDVFNFPIFECTLKDDEREDPPITGEIAMALGIISQDHWVDLVNRTRDICGIIKTDLKSKELDLIDIKIEFGIVDGVVTLIDEISAGNMRVYKDGKKLDYLTLTNIVIK